MERTWSIMDVLQWTARDLAERGSPSARLDAEVLLAHVLGMERVGLYTSHDRPLGADERARFRKAVERRRSGEPVAYIRGEKEFWGLPMEVDPRVLIPRPETEVVVEEALAALGTARLGGRGLDVGAGSGAIAIAILRECPAFTMDAVEVSEEALRVAERNARRHGVSTRLRLRRGHLDEPVRGEPPYDLVTANLPYVPTGDLPALPRGVRDFEPHLALDGGADGLDLVRALVDRAGSLLAPGGTMVLEVGAGQARAVADRAVGRKARIRRDYAGIDRVVVLRRS